jgi:GNAT superfamily N-acetyltransferase
MHIRIRRLIKNDYKTLVDLLAQLGYEDNTIVSLSKRYSLFRRNNGIIFIAEDESRRVVGFAAVAIIPMIQCDGFLARITNICIDEKRRSAGIGAGLIKYIENYCVQKKCVLLEVTTNLKRKKAHEFYLNNGFEETHKRYNKKPQYRPLTLLRMSEMLVTV